MVTGGPATVNVGVAVAPSSPAADWSVRTSGTTNSTEASHGMSGWSQTTTARRAPVPSTRGAP